MPTLADDKCFLEPARRPSVHLPQAKEACAGRRREFDGADGVRLEDRLQRQPWKANQAVGVFHIVVQAGSPMRFKVEVCQWGERQPSRWTRREIEWRLNNLDRAA